MNSKKAASIQAAFFLHKNKQIWRNSCGDIVSPNTD